MPLDHFTLTVPQGKLDEIVAFLTASLGHLGFKEFMRPIPTVSGCGDSRPYMWINEVEVEDAKTHEAIMKKDHIAFTAENIDQVKEFHAAALKAGATCNGPPGPRPQYHPGYYGAFVRDPVCGVNFEVVCHTGETTN